MSRHTTTHAGLTMEWSVARGRYHNSANPFVIVGYVDGVCRMEHATAAITFEQLESRVKDRLSEISRERICDSKRFELMQRGGEQ